MNRYLTMKAVKYKMDHDDRDHAFTGIGSFFK